MYTFTFIYHQIAPRIINTPVQSSFTMSRHWGAPGAHSEPKLLPKHNTKIICKGKKKKKKQTIGKRLHEKAAEEPQHGEQWRCGGAARASLGLAKRAELPFLIWKANESCIKLQIKPPCCSWEKHPHQQWNDGWCFKKVLRANESYPGLIIAVFFSQGWRGLPAKSLSVFWLK